MTPARFGLVLASLVRREPSWRCVAPDRVGRGLCNGLSGTRLHTLFALLVTTERSHANLWPDDP